MNHKLVLLLDQKDSIIIDGVVKIRAVGIKSGKNGGRIKVRLQFETETKIPIYRESYLIKLANKGEQNGEEKSEGKEAKQNTSRKTRKKQGSRIRAGSGAVVQTTRLRKSTKAT